MTYQSLYRRYRPQRFADVKGQDHVSKTLASAVREGRVVHAYLFSGPRGTGKTTSARILAKAVNCLNQADGEPCGTCESCVSITEGRSLDVVEMDAASNRGIDAMRDLISRVALASPGRWKVYIIDEVHMLTTEAANTLLKTLEEPPGHVIFVLATTEPQKILPTIESRTQHFEFRLLPARMLVEHLTWVAKDAGLEVAPEAIELVARRGSGSARDALSALDQVAAAGGIDHEGPGADALIEALCDRDAAGALVAAAERINAGHDPRQIARDLIEHLRQALIATIDRDLVGLPDDELVRLEGQARRLGRAAAVRGMEVLGQALVDMREAPDPRVLLDVSLARLSRPDLDDSPAALLERIERLERSGSGADHGTRAALGDPAPARTAGPPPRGSASPASTPTASAPPAAPATPESPIPPAPKRAAPDAPDDPATRATRPRTPTPAEPGPEAPKPPRTPPAAAGARKALGAVRAAASSPPSTAADGPPPAPTAAPTAAPAAARGGAFPTRDELTLAWGDHIVSSLPQRPKSRFRAGRFVSTEGEVARFALPDTFHLARCRELQGEVEAALAAHFGRPIRLDLVVDDGQGGQPSTAEGATAPPTEQPPDEDEPVDWAELTDAPPGAIPSPLEHVLQVFEGAEVVEEDG